MTPFLKAGLLAISLITASHYAVAAPLNNNLKHQELAAGSALLVDLKTQSSALLKQSRLCRTDCFSDQADDRDGDPRRQTVSG